MSQAPHIPTTIATLRALHSPRIGDLDCTVLIAHVLRVDRAHVLAHPHTPLSPQHCRRITKFCHKRATGYPLAYLTGTKEFYGYDFTVTPKTLIPRPETESLIDYAKGVYATTPRNARIVIVDIGTGSGAIIITLARQIDPTRTTTFIATDISHDALRVAKHNSRMHHVDHAITFLQGDLLNDAKIHTCLIADHPTHVIIVANLPYVDDMQQAQLYATDESRALQFEPALALWSSEGGLHHYRTLIDQTQRFHVSLPDAHIISLYELDPAQISTLLHYHTPRKQEVFHDLGEQQRFYRWDLMPLSLHRT